MAAQKEITQIEKCSRVYVWTQLP